jgi:hypothetical protein
MPKLASSCAMAMSQAPISPSLHGIVGHFLHPVEVGTGGKTLAGAGQHNGADKRIAGQVPEGLL